MSKRLVVPLALIALWSLVGWVPHRAIAGPVATVHALVDGFMFGSLGADIGATLFRAGTGLLLGSVVGVILGLSLAALGRTSVAAEPSLDFLRAIPPLLLLPMFMLTLGYGDLSRIATIAWAAALVVSLHIAAGSRRGRPERSRALRAMRMSRWQRLLWLDAFEALPPFLSAVRQAAGLALVVAVVTEMVVGARAGLGTAALNAQIAYDAPALWAVLVVAGSLGFGASQALLWIERRVVHWEEAYR